MKKKADIKDPRGEMIKYIKRFDLETLNGSQLIRIAAIIAEVEHPLVYVPEGTR